VRRRAQHDSAAINTRNAPVDAEERLRVKFQPPKYRPMTTAMTPRCPFVTPPKRLNRWAAVRGLRGRKQEQRKFQTLLENCNKKQ